MGEAEEEEEESGEWERERRAVQWLAYTCQVGSAWLQRSPSSLHSLILPLKEELYASSSSSSSSIFPPVPLLQRTSLPPYTGRDAIQPRRNTWRLMGPVLWAALHGLLRRQLAAGPAGRLGGRLSAYGWLTPGGGGGGPRSFPRSPSASASAPATPLPLMSPPSSIQRAGLPLYSGIGGGLQVVSSSNRGRQEGEGGARGGGGRTEGRGRHRPGEVLCDAISLAAAGLRRQLAADGERVAALLLENEEERKEGAEEASFEEVWRILEVSRRVREALRMEGLDIDGKKGKGGKNVEESGQLEGGVGEEEESNELGKYLGGSGWKDSEEVFNYNGELLEAICVNPLNPRQAVVATNRKGLVYVDLKPITSPTSFSAIAKSPDARLMSDAQWPKNGWARHAKAAASSTATSLTLQKEPPRRTSSIPYANSGGTAMGIPGYGGIGAWGMGWEDWEDAVEGYVDPPATARSVSGRALAGHPWRDVFLVGSNNTHVYLWEFGKPNATATYGVLPPANTPIPLALASVNALQLDTCGQRLVSAAADGTVSSWHLEVGGRSRVGPDDTRQCFSKQASDVCYVGTSSSLVVTAGYSSTDHNLVMWDMLAPPALGAAFATCHDGGAASIGVANSSGSQPLIVTGGKSGDISIHDFRLLQSRGSLRGTAGSAEASLWNIPKAHSSVVTAITVIPDTSLFLSGSKDGDMKLWDAATCQMLHHWKRVHEKHTFLNARGFGAVMQMSLMDIVFTSNTILTCGADGLVKSFSRCD